MTGESFTDFTGRYSSLKDSKYECVKGKFILLEIKLYYSNKLHWWLI
jgi:hypothetical protein